MTIEHLELDGGTATDELDHAMTDIGDILRRGTREEDLWTPELRALMGEQTGTSLLDLILPAPMNWVEPIFPEVAQTVDMSKLRMKKRDEVIVRLLVGELLEMSRKAELKHKRKGGSAKPYCSDHYCGGVIRFVLNGPQVNFFLDSCRVSIKVRSEVLARLRAY